METKNVSPVMRLKSRLVKDQLVLMKLITILAKAEDWIKVSNMTGISILDCHIVVERGDIMNELSQTIVKALDKLVSKRCERENESIIW